MTRPINPVRAALDLDGRRLSYLDFADDGSPRLALHGHLDQGLMWSELAVAVGPGWRVICSGSAGPRRVGPGRGLLARRLHP
jgi:hypothetical protein